MELQIITATTADSAIIRSLATRIWEPTYVPILGTTQVDYMLRLLYSDESLSRQMREQCQEFWLCSNGTETIGFSSFSKTGSNAYKLHKLYVLPDSQGTGAGRFVLNHIVTVLKQRGAGELTLNVNRYNERAIRFYERFGFTRAYEEDIDIGGGYWMNDFVYRMVL